LLAREQFGSGQAIDRVRLLAMAGRSVPAATFQRVSEAVPARRQLEFTYRARTDDTQPQPTVPPQPPTPSRDHPSPDPRRPRRQLEFTYRARTDDTETHRTVSPQRLTRYRDNWYLDAWCHWRQGLRTFSLECIHHPRLLRPPAIDVDGVQLDQHYAEAYGIFA